MMLVRILGILLMFVLLLSFVAFAEKPKYCYYSPDRIKCDEWSECKNGKWERYCHDITDCINDGKEFKVTGTCSADYKPKQSPQESANVEEKVVDDKELQIREMFAEDFDPVVEDDLVDVISADLIKGGESDALEGTNEAESSAIDQEFVSSSYNKRSNFISYVISSLVVLALVCFLIYYFYFRTKKENPSKSLGSFRKEIRK